VLFRGTDAAASTGLGPARNTGFEIRFAPVVVQVAPPLKYFPKLAV
jgi:hypothetical protein